MKKFIEKQGPFIKTSNSTSKMMKHLLIALLPIIAFTVYKNGVIPYINGKSTIFGLIYPLLIIILSTSLSLIFETLYAYMFLGKKSKKSLMNYIKNSYSIFPGLFFGLVMPINVPISILILGVLISVVVGKLLYGGFGNNIFNPALIGYLFVFVCFSSYLSSAYLNNYELDSITKATPLTTLATNNHIADYDTLIKPYGSLSNLFFGFKIGTLGEISAFMCLLSYLYLSIKKVIKPLIPLIYISIVFIMTLIIGLYNDLGIWYPLLQIFSGGLFFGAVFMATDPVTSPTTKTGQVIYATSLGLLTVVIRFLMPYPEGVMLSILAMNMLVFIFDKIGASARFNKKIVMYTASTLIVLLLFITLSIANIKKEEYKLSKASNIVGFTLVERKKEGNNTIYIVTQKGFVDKIKGRITINNKDEIIGFEILEQKESYYSKIVDVNYIEKLKKEYKNIDNVDTVSGATNTSKALIKMISNTLKIHKEVK